MATNIIFGLILLKILIFNNLLLIALELKEIFFSLKMKESVDDKEYTIGISPNNFEIYNLDNGLKYE